MTKKVFFTEGIEFSFQSASGSIKKNKWYKANIPGTVYDNLIREKLIEDPFYADNELKLQWIAQSDWSYRASFNYPEDFKKGRPVYLVFEGLDTSAEIILNDKVLGHPDNMFRKWQYEVSEFLKEKNNLRINFKSPYTSAKSDEDKYGKLPVALNSERVYIRKAQYSFGWDWGPSFADIGIWKPFYLIQPADHFIKEFTFNTLYVSETEAQAEVMVSFNTALSDEHKIKITVSDESSSRQFSFIPGPVNKIKEKIRIPDPKLWWPNGEGDPNLYTIKITLEYGSAVEDELIKQTGFRIVELKLNDEGKNTFYFRVNGRRIYAKGVNWIPADSFLTRVNSEKYFRLLSSAKKGNMNFVRVWGGGIYENDVFYELCDKLGLLVWQDFMFACACYPEHEEFLNNVAAEIVENVYRLQHHPSIAIWCGNNENEWTWYQEQKKSYKLMTGYGIYSNLIPGILKEIDPDRPYWESTPFSNEDDPNSVFSGNRHQWDLWSNWKDYKSVKTDRSLFVTEFGFQGPANKTTFEKVIPSANRNPQSRLFEFHNKQVEGNERLFRFLSGHLPVRTGWQDFIYLTQLNQGLALETCIEHWRFNYPLTNGSLIWQLNDCWPVSSWSLIDSDLKPKLSFFMVKTAFQSQILKFIENEKNTELYLIDESGKFKGYIELAEINTDNGKVKYKKINVKASGYKSRITSVRFNEDIRHGRKILTATLFNRDNFPLHRSVYNGTEWKYLKLPRPSLKVKLIAKNKSHFLSVKSNKPAFFVSVFSEDLELSNNSVTVLPGEEVLISCTRKSSIKNMNWDIYSLNDYL